MKRPIAENSYDALLGGIGRFLGESRRQAARAVNAVLTMTYWEVGRRIVEFEQKGRVRAAYGEVLLKRLSGDLSRRYGRGFSERNLEQMRLFYLAYSGQAICQTASGKLESSSLTLPISQTVSAKSKSARLPQPIWQTLSAKSHLPRFPLSWSHYVLLLELDDAEARSFYETQALDGGWSVRQLDRQMRTRFYERTLLSKNKAAMLSNPSPSKSENRISPEAEIKDPYVLEFLDLKDEYSESRLEEALIRHLESFLLELGGEFAFIARQKRLRVGDAWYRIDLLLYHRRLRCLILIDLKLDRFTHADAGQMHLYLNYAREHWAMPEENPPVGLILCAKKDKAVAHYALEGLANKILAAEYKTVLPDAAALEAEIRKTRLALRARGLKNPSK